MNKAIALKTTYPHSLEKQYKNDLISYVKDIFITITKDISKIELSYNAEIHKDDANDDLKRILKVLELKISFKLSSFVKKILSSANKVNAFNEKAVKSSFRFTKKANLSISVDDKIKLSMEMFVSDNVRLIKTINSNLLGQVQEVVYSGIRRGVSYSSLSKDLLAKFTINKKRATIIAKDQINKLNSDLTKARHKALGIIEYKWLTSRDERVRDSHLVLSDMICTYDDLNVYKPDLKSKKWLSRESIGATLSNPGNDVLCRCTAIAIING